MLHARTLQTHILFFAIHNLFFCFLSLTLINYPITYGINGQNTATQLAAPIMSYTSLPVEEWGILFGAWHPFILRRSGTNMCEKTEGAVRCIMKPLKRLAKQLKMS